MKLLSFNKALLWKEWRQNRLLFGLLFVLMSLPVANNIRLWLMYTETPPRFFNGEPVGWLSAIMFKGIIAYIDRPGTLLIIAFGLFLLTRERTGNNLGFLLATPVSREEILKAKYFMGAAAVSANMIFYVLFLMIIWLVLPIRFAFYYVMFVFVINTLVLLAVYSLAFCISTIAGNLVSVCLLTLGALFVPAITLGYLSNFFKMDHWMYNLISKVLIIFNSVASLGEARKVALWKIPTLVTLILVCYFLAKHFFKKNKVENNGRFLAIGENQTIKSTITIIFLSSIAMISSAIFRAYQMPSNKFVVGIFGIILIALWQLYSFLFKHKRRAANEK